MSTLLLKVALALHAEGRPVISVTQDKKPYYKGWNDYFCRRQTEDEVKREFSNGAYGMAVVLYPACDNAVLDFDGLHAEEAWQLTGITLPETARNITRSGGSHLIYKMPAMVSSPVTRKVRLVKANCNCTGQDGVAKPCGVDFLVNGYAVWPPTPGYTEDINHPLKDAVALPQEILLLAQAQSNSKYRTTGNATGSIPQGQRKATLVKLAGTLRGRGMSIEAIRAALEADNQARCVPPLEQEEINDIMKSVNKWFAESVAEPEHFTDLGNAQRLVRLHGDDLRFSKQSGWFLWDGKRWLEDKIGEVQRRAKETVRSIYNEAANCTDDNLRKTINDHARKSEAKPRIDAMIALSHSEIPIPILQEQFDTDPWLLNVNNGTLDLRTGQLREHHREDLITKLIPIDYDTDAECPKWLEFLKRITNGDTELVKFLQKAVGYSLTGSVREQCLFMLYGTGANGKSTFINVISSILGDYAKTTRIETLMPKRGDGIPNDVAALAGARLVSAVEAEVNKRLAEPLVKQITGGDKMEARFLHHEFFEFIPTFKLWLAVNHKPRITGTDYAIWRRIRLVPFEVTIPEDQRDPDLVEKLRQELSGILKWAVDGCRMWLDQGLKSPDQVKKATQEYRAESDVLAQFLDEVCIRDEHRTIAKALLYQTYDEWCQRNGELRLTKREFGSRLIERGFADGRKKDAHFWEGITLDPAYVAAHNVNPKKTSNSQSWMGAMGD